MTDSESLRVLVVLTPVQRDFLLELLVDEAAVLHADDHRSAERLAGIRHALEEAPEVTEPWHVMGTRANGGAVGRGTGPIGGCGSPSPCTLSEADAAPFFDERPLDQEHLARFRETLGESTHLVVGQWHGR